MNHNQKRAAVLRAANDARYQPSAAGVLMPTKEPIDMGFDCEVFYKPRGAKRSQLIAVAPNIVPNAALTYLIKAGLAGFSQISAWYIAPFSNATTPTSSLTAANFNTTLSEFTNYVESTRQAWTQDAESGGSIVNGTTLATITIGAGGGTINGIGVMSVSTKSSTSGTCLSGIRFGDERPVQEDDELSFRLTFTFQSAA